MKTILLAILVNISVSAFADDFDRAKRISARKEALQTAIDQRKKDQEEHDRLIKYMLEEYCPTSEDGYWAEEKAADASMPDEKIRENWGKSFSGLWCAEYGFKP